MLDMSLGCHPSSRLTESAMEQHEYYMATWLATDSCLSGGAPPQNQQLKINFFNSYEQPLSESFPVGMLKEKYVWISFFVTFGPIVANS